MKKYISIVCLFLIVSTALAKDKTIVFLELCVKNKDYLVCMEQKKGLSKRQKTTKNSIIDYNFRGPKLNIILEKYTQTREISEDEIKEILSILTDIGCVNLYNDILYYSPVLEDDIISEIIIEALKDEEICEIVFDRIKFFSNEGLHKYSSQILNILNNVNPKYVNIDYSILFFSKGEQKQFFHLLENDLGHNTIADQAKRLLLRTKLGDDNAFKEMVTLLSSSDFETKEEIIKRLGLLGNRDSIIALLSAMNDNQELQPGLTLRAFIIPAIWRNYPKDELFLKYFYNRIDNNQMGGEDGISKFYNELELWSKKNLNYKLDLSKAKLTILDPYRSVRKYPRQ